MKIYFIRHGETTGDVENRYGGAYDDHLSEKGLEQAQGLANTLIDKNIEEIFAGPLIRTQETSGIISKTIGIPVTTIDDLRERNQYGILSGMTKTEAAEKHPDLVELLKDKLNTIDGAESFQDFLDRFLNVFKKIVTESHSQTIAIVSHGGPVRVLYRDLLMLGELLYVGDCAMLEIDYTDGVFSLIQSQGVK